MLWYLPDVETHLQAQHIEEFQDGFEGGVAFSALNILDRSEAHLSHFSKDELRDAERGTPFLDSLP